MNFVNEGHSVREGVGEREFPVEEGVGKPWVSQRVISLRVHQVFHDALVLSLPTQSANAIVPALWPSGASEMESPLFVSERAGHMYI